ncbi:8019_t:CDS:2 [Racocetra fulgida]|uniref:8019_t:CDS:1 n=1 Tax=Racocetra fulgida TaxID=60492 RepID=A0A9N9D9C2_9GLOM|nr:8019_t:CDS:2 [Racocetra fulgida]
MEEFLSLIKARLFKELDYGEFEDIKEISDGSSLIEHSYWRRNHRHVVLKFLKEQCKDEYYKKIIREDFHSMVLQYYNKPLREHLKEVSKQDWDYKLKMAKDIANGLKYIHAENIIHCDLRPSIEEVINLLKDIELDCVYRDDDYIPKICLGRNDTSISKKEPCLMVIKGSPQNQYFFIRPDETFIGRRNSNHIIIKDQEIAKIHARLKIPMEKDDMIKMGRSIFQYLPTGEYESRIDKLLPIYNRAYLEKSLANEFLNARENEQNMSLLFFDLDNFKSINDGNNHEAGDYALKELAKLIQNSHARAEDIFARYGGDEFTILLKNTDVKSASEIAEKIRSPLI